MGNLVTVVIGHRGAGKKSLLKRLRWHLRDQEAEFYNLDGLIEEKIGSSIDVLFTEHGERYFRKLEKQFFLELIQKVKHKTFIVVSSGFDLSVIPQECQVLWLQRKTDKDGRIHLGRAIVHRKIQSLQDFQMRAEERNFNYIKRSDWIYEVPEGQIEESLSAMEIEYQLLFGNRPIGGYLELNQIDVMSRSITEATLKKIEKYLNRSVAFVLDYHFINGENIKSVESFIKLNLSEKWVLRIEKQESLDRISAIDGNLTEWLSLFSEVHINFDLKIDMNFRTFIQNFQDKKNLVLYTHNFNINSVMKYEESAKDFSAHFLGYVDIEEFGDLDRPLEWQRKSALERSLVFKSKNRKWDWVTLLLKGKQKISFWGEGFWEKRLYPSLFEWLLTSEGAQNLGVSLGENIYSIPSIVETADFFKNHKGSLFQASIQRSELKQAIQILNKYGVLLYDLQSPLTDAYWEHLQKDSSICDTLVLSKELVWSSVEKKVIPDFIERLKYLVDFQKEIIVWSHRERLSLLQSVFPNAIFFSARTGERRKGSPFEILNPKVIVWDALRSSEIQLPQKDWKPELVIDLGINENSLAREYADSLNCAYIGGHELLKKRYLLQCSFWKEHCQS